MIEGTYLNFTKAIYNKPIIVNIIPNGEKNWNHFLKSQEWGNGPTLPTFIQYSVRAVRQEKWIKGILTAMEEIKLSVFADDMILYFKDSKDSILNS
jgi:hypothetical protein